MQILLKPRIGQCMEAFQSFSLTRLGLRKTLRRRKRDSRPFGKVSHRLPETPTLPFASER